MLSGLTCDAPPPGGEPARPLPARRRRGSLQRHRHFRPGRCLSASGLHRHGVSEADAVSDDRLRDIVFGVRLQREVNRAEMDAIVESALRHAALWDEVKDHLTGSGFVLPGGQQQRHRTGDRGPARSAASRRALRPDRSDLVSQDRAHHRRAAACHRHHHPQSAAGGAVSDYAGFMYLGSWNSGRCRRSSAPEGAPDGTLHHWPLRLTGIVCPSLRGRLQPAAIQLDETILRNRRNRFETDRS